MRTHGLEMLVAAIACGLFVPARMAMAADPAERYPSRPIRVVNRYAPGCVILSVATPARSALASDVLTIAEAGVRGYEATSWVGMFAPRATPASIVQKWNAEISRQIREPAIRALQGGRPGRPRRQRT